MKNSKHKTLLNIFCDSELGLNWAKKNTFLKKESNILLKSSSPYLLLNSKHKFAQFDKTWNKKKIKLFTNNINVICKNIFQIISKNKLLSEEEACFVLFTL